MFLQIGERNVGNRQETCSLTVVFCFEMVRKAVIRVLPCVLYTYLGCLIYYYDDRTLPEI